MRDIVFLDIDGVIQTVESCITQNCIATGSRPFQLVKAASPKSVALLRALQRELPSLEMVLHSSWVLYVDRAMLEDVFDHLGIKIHIPAKEACLSGRIPRLKAFIETIYKPDQFVILDDAWQEIREGLPDISTNQCPPIGQELGFDLRAFVATVRYFKPDYKLPVCFF